MEVTAKQLSERSVHLANCLIHYGIKPGDKVGICSENRSEFAYVLFGTLVLGASLAPMNTTYGERNNLAFLSFGTILQIVEFQAKLVMH